MRKSSSRLFCDTQTHEAPSPRSSLPSRSPRPSCSSRLIAGAFIGRAESLDIVDQAIDATRHSRSQFILLTGEPGIGKTRMLAEIEKRVQSKGLRLARGRCAEVPGAPEYWPFSQIFRTLSAEMGSALDVELAPDSPAQDLIRTGEVDLSSADSTRFRLLGDLIEWLRAICQDTPIVILIDDLHAADTASAHLLAFIAAELEASPLLFVATARDTELEDRPKLRTDLGRFLERARIIPQTPLSREEVALLARNQFGRELASPLLEVLFSRSAGNPLFLRQMTDWLLADKHLFDQSEEEFAARIESVAPEGIRQILLERLRSLSQTEHESLSLAAVLGQEFPRDLLVILSKEQGFEDPTRLIDGLADRRLIRESKGETGQLRFTHVLLRDVFYEALPTAERRALHSAACEVILAHRDLQEDFWLSAAAHHALAGSHPEVFTLASRAGERALLRCAYDGAADWFRSAIGLLGQLGGSTGMRARLEERLATALWNNGASAEARAGYERALDLARISNEAETYAAAAIGFAGRTDRALQSETKAESYLKEALAQLGPAPSPLRAEVLHRLASCLYHRADPDERKSIAQQAIECAEQVGDPRLLSYALSSKHFLLWRPGCLTQRRPIGLKQLECAEKAPRSDALAFAHFNCAKDAFEAGDGIAVDQHIALFGKEAERLHQPFFSFEHAGLVATRLASAGRLAEAEQAAMEILRLGQLAQSTNALPAYATLLFSIREMQGRLPELEPHIAQLVQANPQMTSARLALAEARLAMGERTETRAFIASLFSSAEGFDAVLPDDFNGTAGLQITSRIVLSLHAQREGDGVDEERWAKVLLDRLQRFRGQCAVIGFGNAWEGAWDLYRGRLALLVGDFDQAEEALEASAHLHARFGAQPFIAHSWLALAELAARRPNGKIDDTRRTRAAADALRIYEKIGMPHYQERAKRLNETRSPLPRISASVIPAVDTAPAVFQKAGDVWQVRFEGLTTQLRDVKGFRDLAKLLGNPKTEMPAIELYGEADPGEPALGARTGDEPLVLDPRAQREYACRARELQQELEAARENSDLALVERCRQELDVILSELRSATGLGGRSRRQIGPAERARKAVSNRIRAAIGRIENAHPPLGAHLRLSIRTGRSCSYQDTAGPIDWVL